MASLHFTGQCASPGFSTGIVVELGAAAARRAPTGDRRLEAQALRDAIASAVTALSAVVANASGEAADILAFQVAMLEDETLAAPAFAAIDSSATAETAWADALNAEIAGYAAAEDEYFRARGGDLVDIRDRVLEALGGDAGARLAPGSLLLADDLTPSRFLSTDWAGGAILLRQGSTTSHVAMLARARGVPMLVGLGQASLAGRKALIIAHEGDVIVDASEAEEMAFEAARRTARARATEADTFLNRPAVTRDGTPVATLINIADPAELDLLDPTICDGIGLVRTELLFEGRALPSEDEQTATYARMARWAAGRPVTIRTLDAGADKPIPGLTPEGESNPFLGLRGVRLTLQHRDVFLAQLRALARAALDGDIEIMIPMVTVPAEFAAARALLDEACVSLERQGIAYRRPKLGMMVEVPAAALTIEDFPADFFSIGSNDLVQYVMAAGRDIASVASLADPANPAVLKLVGAVADYGARAGIKVSICGDAAGEERLIPLLLDRGLRVLSMAPRLLGAAKRVIANLDLVKERGDG